jgi:hypothetical protein
VGEHLPSIPETLASILSTEKTKQQQQQKTNAQLPILDIATTLILGASQTKVPKVTGVQQVCSDWSQHLNHIKTDFLLCPSF